MPDLDAILTIESNRLRVDVLGDPTRSAFFDLQHVQMMLEGKTNMAYSPEMRLLKQPWSETVTIAPKDGKEQEVKADRMREMLK